MQTVTEKAAIVRNRLYYDSASGHFVWRDGRLKGRRAGCQGPIGYRLIFLRAISSHPIREHRLAFLWMLGRWPVSLADHINGDRADNRWANLREATPSQNSINSKVRSDCRTGVTGVAWDTRSRRWRARIKANGRDITLGAFKKIEDAVVARRRAEAELHGEFTRSAVDV